MATRPLRVALTGGIATGKSYCLEQFRLAGAATIDADVLARQAVATGTAGFNAIRSRFGAAVLTADGALDREALGRLVFADLASRRALETIVHPPVFAAIQRFFEHLSHGGHHVVGIADIPLLYETGHQSDFDAVVVVSCRPEQQIDRLIARSGLSRDEAARRVVAQLPIEEKVRHAEYVIDTSGTLEETDAQVARTWAELNERASGPRSASS